ncbi:cysteine desulfurase [Oikeobacillus pervagus]|uniref:cysteine desulfurase n=1 Tax=Oikeobacillus pervagus TaxID=1325931 RepID=A0AAJ1WIP3_9BACI|nr:cysteine desulfurase family protein [Oikeobacillus pervagus]MDQ0214608.1 cysteine desulfurase [Oikeobacillus pervagus]
MQRIYLDHAATTPVHPEVVEVMRDVLINHYGNPSSIHSFGRESRHILDQARTTIAASVGAKFHEIIFTSGGTEADNLAIIGAARALKANGKHIITSSIEHHAVLHTCEFLEKEGFDITYLPVNEEGVISVDDVKSALREDTILVSIMYGNNEVGSLQPIAEIGQLLQHHSALFHTDAVQAYGVEKIDIRKLHVDFLSVSAHKINGPKGIGFLFVKEGAKFEKRFFGGEQERKRRAGTENIASIAAFAKAVEIAQQTIDERNKKYAEYKQGLMQVLKSKGVEFHINGSAKNSLPHVLNLSFPGTDVEAMLVNLDLAGIAVSSGSACTAGSIEPSHVLVAMFGKESERLQNSIRFSFGMTNHEDEIVKVGETISSIINRLRY